MVVPARGQLLAKHEARPRRSKEWTFEDYGRELDHTPEDDLPAPDSERPDAQLLLQEAKIGCTSGMLLCLDREQRLVYVPGEIFGVTDRVGAELLDISRGPASARSWPARVVTCATSCRASADW